MTYNFDPERWHDDQLARLEFERRSGKLSQREFDLALADVDRRYEDMLTRLDATYQLPSASRPAE